MSKYMVYCNGLRCAIKETCLRFTEGKTQRQGLIDNCSEEYRELYIKTERHDK